MRFDSALAASVRSFMRRAGVASGPSAAAAGAAPRPARRRRAVQLRFAYALAAGALLYLVVPRRTADLKLDAAHLTTRQWLGDAYWAARAMKAEAAPAVRHRHYHYNSTAARHECRPQAPELVLHLKVPKAASTTVFDLIEALSSKNRYRVNNRPQYVDPMHRTRSATQYARYFFGLKPRTVRSAHGAYLDFDRLLGDSSWTRAPPAYVGLVREPTTRLRSHYDYLHWGPRSPWAMFWKGQDGTAAPFWECVEARRHDHVDEGRGGCLYWANVQLTYFCGVDEACTRGNAATLRRALAHARAFAVVGVVEDLGGFLNVLERVLPGYFAGVRARYARDATQSRTTRHKRAEAPPAAAAAYLKNEVLRFEYLLYDAVARDFGRQKRVCHLPLT